MGLSLFAVLVFTFVVFAFETALDVRQRAVLRSPEEPKKLYDVVGQIDKHNAVVAKKEEGEKKEEVSDMSCCVVLCCVVLCCVVCVFKPYTIKSIALTIRD